MFTNSTGSKNADNIKLAAWQLSASCPRSSNFKKSIAPFVPFGLSRAGFRAESFALSREEWF
jgi:hypothetical protein